MKEKLQQITEQELNWLYYGDEINQVIGKLTNEENKLKNMIGQIISMGKNTIIEALSICAHNVYEEGYNQLFIQLLESGQVERLKILDQKYNLQQYYNETLGCRYSDKI
jgi:hypothetical protein